jgi:hypothetical protein
MGAKLISEEQPPERRIVKMSEMRPCDWGRIIEGSKIGHLVMRTASSYKFEVMNMTAIRVDSCWTNKDASIRVELVENGERFKFEIEGQ